MRLLVRQASVVAALLAALLLSLTPTAAQADETESPTQTPLVLAGVAGLQWSDVDAARTPNLWRLVDGASVASVSVRTLTPTCPLDAWLSLSAGSRVSAATDEDALTDDADGDLSGDAVVVGCADMPLLPATAEPVPVTVPGWSGLVDDETTGPTAEAGALGDLAAAAGVCTTAAGPGAAVALADASGDVPRYVSRAADLTATDVADCPVGVVDLGELPDAAVDRTEAVSTLDETVGSLSTLLPDGGRLVVAGISDTPNGPADLQVVVDWTAPGGAATWLSSTSARWPGVVVSADLAATVADAITSSATRPPEPDEPTDDATDEPAEHEASAFTGSALERGDDRRLSVSRTVENRQYLGVLTEVLPLMTPVLVGVLALADVLVVAGLLLARRRTRSTGPDGPGAPGTTGRRLALGVLLVASSLPVAATLATLTRWWVGATPVTLLAAALSAIALTAALVAWALRLVVPPGPWRLPTALAAVTWCVLTLDGLTGTTLQQGSLLGPAPSLGARFYGFSNSVFAVYSVAGLVLAAGLAALLRDAGARRRTRVAVAAAVGLATTAIDGLPPFGADLGGILALVPAFAVLVAGVAGWRLTWRRVLAVAIGTVAVVAVVAVVDWAMPGPATHLGGFVQSVLDGGAFAVVVGKAAGAWATVANPAGAFAVVVCAGTAWAVLDPARARLHGVAAAYRADPLLRKTVVSLVTVAVVGTVMNDSGIVVAVYVLLVATPFLVVGPLEHTDSSAGGTSPTESADGTTAPSGRRTSGPLLARTPAVAVGVCAGLLVALLLGAAALPARGLASAGDVAATGTEVLDDEPVVIIGTEGLRWADVAPAATPTLWGMLRDGASATGVTAAVTGPSADCHAAGWLGLGSGRSPVTGEFVDGVWTCAPWDVTAATGSGTAATQGSAQVEGWEGLTTLQSASEFQPRLGVLGDALAEGDVCSTAVGPGAALALAGTGGDVDRYRTLEAALAEPGDAFSCAVTMVDAGSAPYHPTGEGSTARPVPDDATTDAEARADALRAVDTTVRRVLSVVPEDATVMVLDVGNPAPVRPALGVGVVRTDTDTSPAYLTTSSTRWLGVVRLLDLPVTLVEAYDLPRPTDFSGAPLTLADERPTTVTATARELDSLTTRDHALRVVTGSITGIPVLVSLAALALVVLWLPRLRRRSPRPARVWSRALDVLLLACASLPAATFLMSTWGWWRGDSPALALWLSLGVSTALVCLVAALAPRRPVWAGPTVLATITFAVLTLDAVLGTPLHRGSPLGAAPTLGGRFYGFGNPTYSVYAVAAVFCAAGIGAVLARRLGRVAGGVVASVIGLVALAVSILPSLGADVGGGLVLLPVMVVVVLAVVGARITWSRLAVAGGAGVLLVAVIGYLDWLRPVAERTHLGAFVQSAVDGTALETIWRKAGYAWRSLSGGFDAWLALAVLLLLVLALWGPHRWRPRWLVRSEAAWPLLRPVLIALLIAGVGGAVANDYGIRVVSLMLFAAVPLVGLITLRTDDAEPVDRR
ncbi:hypothetical protein GCM10009718_20360 [Isoptericola halotolerans]|uniref:Uncharacterized protein n=1 Tax=Isoptericola halotolerans TaxID=300560 RepID=A0ABX2A708_9MICO|nr:hypothetical protein [Isoptericola halotolerans]NOV98381.1 hypothetical protein [Isoptericola halotolerans]